MQWKKQWKRAVSALLAIVLIFGCTSLSGVAAAEGEPELGPDDTTIKNGESYIVSKSYTGSQTITVRRGGTLKIAAEFKLTDTGCLKIAGGTVIVTGEGKIDIAKQDAPWTCSLGGTITFQEGAKAKNKISPDGSNVLLDGENLIVEGPDGEGYYEVKNSSASTEMANTDKVEAAINDLYTAFTGYDDTNVYESADAALWELCDSLDLTSKPATDIYNIVDKAKAHLPNLKAADAYLRAAVNEVASLIADYQTRYPEYAQYASTGKTPVSSAQELLQELQGKSVGTYYTAGYDAENLETCLTEAKTSIDTEKAEKKGKIEGFFLAAAQEVVKSKIDELTTLSTTGEADDLKNKAKQAKKIEDVQVVLATAQAYDAINSLVKEKVSNEPGDGDARWAAVKAVITEQKNRISEQTTVDMVNYAKSVALSEIGKALTTYTTLTNNARDALDKIKKYITDNKETKGWDTRLNELTDKENQNIAKLAEAATTGLDMTAINAATTVLEFNSALAAAQAAAELKAEKTLAKWEIADKIAKLVSASEGVLTDTDFNEVKTQYEGYIDAANDPTIVKSHRDSALKALDETAAVKKLDKYKATKKAALKADIDKFLGESVILDLFKSYGDSANAKSAIEAKVNEQYVAEQGDIIDTAASEKQVDQAFANAQAAIDKAIEDAFNAYIHPLASGYVGDHISNLYSKEEYNHYIGVWMHGAGISGASRVLLAAARSTGEMPTDVVTALEKQQTLIDNASYTTLDAVVHNAVSTLDAMFVDDFQQAVVYDLGEEAAIREVDDGEGEGVYGEDIRQYYDSTDKGYEAGTQCDLLTVSECQSMLNNMEATITKAGNTSGDAEAKANAMIGALGDAKRQLNRLEAFSLDIMGETGIAEDKAGYYRNGDHVLLEAPANNLEGYPFQCWYCEKTDRTVKSRQMTIVMNADCCWTLTYGEGAGDYTRPTTTLKIKAEKNEQYLTLIADREVYDGEVKAYGILFSTYSKTLEFNEDQYSTEAAQGAIMHDDGRVSVSNMTGDTEIGTYQVEMLWARANPNAAAIYGRAYYVLTDGTIKYSEKVVVITKSGDKWDTNATVTEKLYTELQNEE